MQQTLKSPIKRRTLHQAGESLRRAQLDLIDDRLLTPGVAIAVLWGVAAVEWIWTWQGVRPTPVYMTATAAVLTAVFLWRTRSAWKILKQLRLGIEGERAVGEYLDRLRGLGLRVYHDIPGDSGNIDHVIISTRGVFSIETKTRSKPVKGDCKVAYDGKAISVNGGAPDRSAIVRAKAQARQLRRLLKEHTGQDYPVRPVVLFPGWYVDTPDPSAQSEVWVLSPNALPMWIGNAPEIVETKDVKHAAGRLAAYVRDYE